MKTSNKMLLGLAVAIILLMVIQMISLKKNISEAVKTELNETVQETVISE